MPATKQEEADTPMSTARVTWPATVAGRGRVAEGFTSCRDCGDDPPTDETAKVAGEKFMTPGRLGTLDVTDRSPCATAMRCTGQVSP